MDNTTKTEIEFGKLFVKYTNLLKILDEQVTKGEDAHKTIRNLKEENERLENEYTRLQESSETDIIALQARFDTSNRELEELKDERDIYKAMHSVDHTAANDLQIQLDTANKRIELCREQLKYTKAEAVISDSHIAGVIIGINEALRKLEEV